MSILRIFSMGKDFYKACLPKNLTFCYFAVRFVNNCMYYSIVKQINGIRFQKFKNQLRKNVFFKYYFNF